MFNFTRKKKNEPLPPLTPPMQTIFTLYVDMAAQPHLLIAGATGSGKSVVVNGIIHALLFRTSCDVEGGARFILIDPKRVELSAFRGCPHTVLYASEPDTILSALNRAMDITEERYKRMQQEGTKKYSGADLYIIIDEFADLMTTQRRAVQPLIQRLAQIGRAAKAHLIVCTQTPIAKVLPTEIKCNFDARLGLRTRSAQDSRNILGYSGLETLPRYGQGIYMKPEGDTKYIIPMVSDEDMDEILKYQYEMKRRLRSKR